MHFDDRLATVLRNPASGDAIARAQFRQLLDLLGTLPGDARSEAIDDAYLRLTELSAAIPPAERAAILEEPVLRLRSPRLVAQLALAEPAVAVTAMARADLAEEQWLDLIPALPVRARGITRHRRGLPLAVQALLHRLGVADRGLPPVEGIGPWPTPEQEKPQPPVVDAPQPDIPPIEEPQPHIDEIGAIVRRIEAFRKTRQYNGADHGDHDASLPLGQDNPPPRPVSGFDFIADPDGRIVWADAAIAAAAVGLRLASRDPESPVQSSPQLLAAFRHRQPITGAALSIMGARAVAGEWRIDAAPRFDQQGGRFVGYIGKLRRPLPGSTEPPPDNEGDRLRQILHELRTPVNAIQGFAEVIQQQLFGPTPHEYRALAATIASDGARMLAGFEELERLIKLDSGAMTLDSGECDLLPILTATIAQLESFNRPRRSGLDLDSDEPALTVAMAPAEAERLVWRLLATLAGATSPGEVLRLRARRRGNGVRLLLRLPVSLAFKDSETLFDSGAGAAQQALSAGMFGSGFALRLAATEARAAGGALERRQEKLRLVLPAPSVSPATVSELSLR